MHRHLLILLCLVAPTTAGAGCDLSEFGRGGHAVRDLVDNQFAHFGWGSDTEAKYSLTKIWNYIQNLSSTKSLSAVWVKAEIRIPIANPLPPGGTFCNRYPVAGASERPDPDAPILYGTNNQRQGAAAYVPIGPAGAKGTPGSPSEKDLPSSPSNGLPRTPGPGGQLPPTNLLPYLGLEISTSYIDRNQKTQDLFFDFNTSNKGNGLVQLYVYRSPEITLAVSNFSDFLSQNQISRLTSELSAQNAEATITSLAEYIGKDNTSAHESISQLFTDSELKAIYDKKFIVFSGADKFFSLIQGKELKQESADILAFDKDRRPLLATRAAIYVPVE
jgi:hypothetical protein